MAGDKLSAREAALIAQARAAQVAATEPGPPAAAEPVAPGLDAAERAAALIAAARAETERHRWRQRRLYIWAPVAFIAAAGLWTLLWLWQKL